MIAIIALASAGGLATTALWPESRAPVREEVAIGDATDAHAARRRDARSLDWRLLEKNSPIYVGDSVFVGRGGHARLVVEGSVLELSEETLVVITRRQADLVEGELFAASQARYTVATRGAPWEHSGRALFRASPTGERSVEVLSGRASRDGTSVVAPGFARLSSSGASTTGRYSARGLAPEHNARLRPLTKFRFHVEGGSGTVSITDDVGRTRELPEDEDLVLPPGGYTWFSIGDDNARRSSSLRFRVLDRDRPEIVYPTSESLVVVPETEALSVVFDPVSGALLHEVTLWQPLGGFREVVRTSLPRATFSRGLPEGEYVTTARAVVDELNWPSATARTFHLTHKAPPKAPETQDAQILPLRP